VAWNPADIVAVLDWLPLNSDGGLGYPSGTSDNAAVASTILTAASGCPTGGGVQLGTGQYLTLVRSPIAGKSNWLYCAWHDITDATQDAQAWNRAFSFGDGGSGTNGHELSVRINTAGHNGCGPIVVVGDGTYQEINLNAQSGYGDGSNRGEWHHVGWVLSGGIFYSLGDGLCYYAGTGGGALTNDSAATVPHSSCYIGRGQDANSSKFMGGQAADYLFADPTAGVTAHEYLSLLQVSAGNVYPTPTPRRYLYSSFGPGSDPSNIGESLRLHDSTDGVNFRDLPVAFKPPDVDGFASTVRDPRPFLLTDGYVYWSYTCGGNGTNHTQQFGIGRVKLVSNSPRLIAEHVAFVSCAGLLTSGTNLTFAPTPVQYPGKPIGIIVMLSNDNGTTFTLAYLEPTSSAGTLAALQGTWTTPVALGATWGTVTPFDPGWYLDTQSGDGFPYKLAVADRTTNLPAIFRSASPTTGFTLFKDGRSGQFGDTGVGAAVEGMCLITHPSGTGFRLYRDKISIGVCYSDCAADWTPDPNRHDVVLTGFMGRGAPSIPVRHGGMVEVVPPLPPPGNIEISGRWRAKPVPVRWTLMNSLVDNTLVKAAGSTPRWVMDLADHPAIRAGDAVASITSVTVSPSGPIVTGEQIEDGDTAVSAVFSGGTVGTDYTATFLLTLDTGEGVELSGPFKVE
jgi:hypothetical protein